MLKGRSKSRDRVSAIAADDGSASDVAICIFGDANDAGDISKSWLVDSAASAQMCWMRASFYDYDNTTGGSVTMGDKGSVANAGVWTVILNVIVHVDSRNILLKNVLHTPTMGFKLIWVGMMEERGATVSYKSGKAIINVSGKDVACGTRKSGLYHWDVAHQRHAAAVASLQLWHGRLGHANVAGVKWMMTQNKVGGQKCTAIARKGTCEPCVHGKASMTPMPRPSGVCVTMRLELVHLDLGGAMPEPSRGGALHFGKFEHDFSR